ncbi:CRISPR-associated protein Csc3 [Capilliphycus salinus ALCB114379]|uniref:CRISPR-associated protein Csc3 n=1 Tax=Capilliphycus salinus TaxID=2768948 RepID=UPI0039A4A551
MIIKPIGLLSKKPETLDEKYFSQIRPKLYEHHATHYQWGSRAGRTLAEHLDSACQFVLTVTHIADVPEDKRSLILAATSVHDLNKLDRAGRNVKTLARDPEFLKQQLKLACVDSLVKTAEDLELVRRLIERHSGHNTSDGLRFFPEDEEIEKYAAMLIGADLFDLGIPEAQRIGKIQKELTVAFARPSCLFRVSISEDRGYITALLLSACEEVLQEQGLHPLAIYPDGELFEGESWPEKDITEEIACRWNQKINRVFAGNIEQLIHPTKDGIKVNHQALQQNPDEALIQVQALLEKKKAGFKTDKVSTDVRKYGDAAGTEAVNQAAAVGLLPVTNAEEFAISEGLKAAYLSYRETGLTPKEVWDRIGSKIELSESQRSALEPFNPQYGRCLFAAKAVTKGMEAVTNIIQDSFELRVGEQPKNLKTDVPEEMIVAVHRILNLPLKTTWEGSKELNFYINANPRKRCSLGATTNQVQDLISNNMPPGTKVQSFSNRLPGGISAEPKRKADSLAARSYQLMALGANFPNVNKQDPLYLHFALPEGSSPELLRIWREFLKETAATNPEGGTVTVDEAQLYRDNIKEFKSNKVVGFAFPKRLDFIHSTVVIPLVWGDVNASLALLKSLRLALELSLGLNFPFTLSGNLEIEPWNNIYARVEGIPSALQSLLGNGQYKREGHAQKNELQPQEKAEEILKRLRCVGELAFFVSSPKKRDDCLYDLARAAQRPLNLYYVLLRWILREQDEPNLESNWNRIRQPLKDLLESLMPEEESLTRYLKEAAKIAEEAKLRGSSFRRTAQAEPFTEFIAAIRSRKSHLSWDVVFASLVQQYHTRLDRIREHGVGATKYEKVKQYYDVLRKIFDEIYCSRPERILADRKTLEAAYLFFLQEARQELKQQPEKQSNQTETTNK